MITLDNGQISISVKDHGAELSSIKHNSREYLWQADPEFWARHSPVLFPIVGNVWQKQYRSQGKVFNLGQHGFARDMDFTFLSKTDNEVWFKLESDAATLEKFPYSFRLELGYRLVENSVEVLWKVVNTNNGPMSFQIGAHPAFHWPLLSNEAIAAGTQAMKEELKSGSDRGWFKFDACGILSKSVIGEGGCIDPSLQKDVQVDEGGFLPLDLDSFSKDALVFEDGQVHSVTLCSQDKTPYLTLTFDAPVIGLWSSPGKNAPFVCIEPWYGRTDDMNYLGEFEDRKWIQKLEEGEEFNSKYTITIH